MRLVHAEALPPEAVPEEGAREVTVRWLLARREGAPNFAMRLFEVAPGGYTPRHQHDWEHEVYVLAGGGEVTTAEGPVSFTAGDAILVPPNEIHQFRNTGSGALRFLCLIPLAPPSDCPG
jgi:quercetin dioxygenase-like cupin family protein